MKNIFYKSCLVLASVSWLSSCKPEKDLVAPDVTSGSLDLTTYVAIGNSLTAGYADNGLYYNGQKSSYVNIIAEQFKLANPSLVFNTPFVEATSVGCGGPQLAGTGTGFPRTITVTVAAPLGLKNVKNCNNVMGLAPTPVAAQGDGKILFQNYGPNGITVDGSDLTGLFLSSTEVPQLRTAPSIYASKGPFHNMGVPGARAIDINRAGYGADNLIKNVSVVSLGPPFVASASIANPFFSRFAKVQNTSSILSDALLLNPTFFSLFIGSNDVLLWASAGGPSADPNFQLEGATPTITPINQFSDSIDVIVNALTAKGAKGIIVNISDITGAAFFTFNKPDTKYYIINEHGDTVKMRENDMLLLTAPQDSLLCHGMGATKGYPIPKQYTLTFEQQIKVIAAISGYNAKLRAVAKEKDLAFFDMDAFTKANQSGLKSSGVGMSGEFVTGGIFSLDGLHLTPRGYAALANEMLKTINAKFGSNFPGVDLSKKNAVVFPD
jgi:hypothetical protein